MTTATVAAPTLRLGGREIPVVPPTIRDPRLHLAAVIVSIHVLGQIWLDFDVSIAQILIAIGTCAAIEVVFTLARSGRLVWPASAMLTGSGVALILRVPGTEHGDWWSLHAWHWFALVAGGSLATKYVIRHRGTHVFNPSNVGLVVAFILLGSTRSEPLDFWWGPLDAPMVVAYLIIIGGGLAITARLHLLAMGMAFWLALAAGTGLLALSGHCISARWSLDPICGAHFWWIVVTSPEVLIFLFFMITDPKTVPEGRVGRVLFAVAIAATSSLLIAPWRTEFGAKVGLLGGLVVLCALRPVFDRFAPVPGSPEDGLRPFARRLLFGTAHRRGPAPGGVIAVVVAAIAGVGIVAAGRPAREAANTIDAEVLAVPAAIASDIDPARLPEVTVDPEVTALDDRFAGPAAGEVVAALIRNLEVEAQALAAHDLELLATVDHGARLTDMQRRLLDGQDGGRTVLSHYRFDSAHLVVTFPHGPQSRAKISVDARGTQEEIVYDREGREVSRSESACEIVFALDEGSDGRWFIIATDPLEF